MIVCDFCEGRGFQKQIASDSFPEKCSFCGGAREFTLASIAARIGEDSETVKRLIRWRFRGKGTPRKETAMRIFEKLAALAWPS